MGTSLCFSLEAARSPQRSATEEAAESLEKVEETPLDASERSLSTYFEVEEVFDEVLAGLKERKREETAAGESRLEQVLVRKGMSKPSRCKGKCFDVAKKAVNQGKDAILDKANDDNRDNELDQDDGSVRFFFNQLAIDYQHEGQVDFQGMWDGVVYWWKKLGLHKTRTVSKMGGLGR